MSEPSRLERRLALCEGHWALGERAEAVAALERAAADSPSDPRIGAESARMLEELGDGADADGIRERLLQLCDAAADETDEAEALPPLATSTLAELLAAQGHEEKALRVAEDVLRRNPNDARARAMQARLAVAPPPPPASGERRVLAELERWLANLKSRRTRSPRSHGGAMP